MRKRVDRGCRLPEGDRFEIQRRDAAGEMFAAATTAVGCSTKSIQRFMRHTGGMRPKAWDRDLRRLIGRPTTTLAQTVAAALKRA
ncbi:hypothetical protein [Anaeromyxobacter diazotrophicus]|uniref:Uncharacterized protein n=1 Tax=Anaeromyxobacter diazotrophicus TaxID=2590199 RepID=A0A7I9VHT8_9BACT|nr:hypothetical protein [Anaeromyxobacter diazotrophicus]GEJ55966.1 hypothetical protein AMYX_07070 [Anaeromyxobacter diazotrophicus]